MSAAFRTLSLITLFEDSWVTEPERVVIKGTTTLEDGRTVDRTLNIPTAGTACSWWSSETGHKMLIVTPYLGGTIILTGTKDTLDGVAELLFPF